MKRQNTGLESNNSDSLRAKKAIFFLIAAIAVSLCVYLVFFRLPALSQSPAELAAVIVKKCADTPYRPSCYEKEIPKLMDTHVSMEDAFTVTEKVQDADGQFLYCHTTAHALSLKETQKNPNEWKDVLLRCPFAVCNYGCLHGALVARFRQEHLSDEQIEKTLPDVMDICEAREGYSPTDLDRAMCYHGMGHLAMYMTGGKPDKAINVCERVATRGEGRDQVDTCIEGVFMTVFQNIDPEDRALVKDILQTKETVAPFCALYGKYEQNCRRESYPLYFDEIFTPEGLTNFCAYATDETALRSCYFAVMNMVATRVFENDDGLQKIREYCPKISTSTKKWCYTGAATRLVQIDPLRYVRKANDVCAIAEEEGDKEYCYGDLLFYARFTFASKDSNYVTYCQSLSDPWAEQCLNQNL
jgi:hypothetical protein